MDDSTEARAGAPATAARIYDYLLGGSYNFPADRAAAAKLVEQFPVVPLAARANRATLRRMMSYLIDNGVRQFLDIGSGMPTQANVHEVAQGLAPDSRVVYVDIDPLAVAESRQILSGNAGATAILGDLRLPHEILDHAQVRQVLDFGRPVALLLMGILHFVTDDDQAATSVAQLVEALPAGSYLAISHLASESMALVGTRDDSYEVVEDLYRRQTTTPVGARSHDQVARFFAGTTLVEPGLVWIPQWRPAPGDPQDFADDPRRSGWWAGLGRITR